MQTLCRHCKVLFIAITGYEYFTKLINLVVSLLKRSYFVCAISVHWHICVVFVFLIERIELLHVSEIIPLFMTSISLLDKRRLTGPSVGYHFSRWHCDLDWEQRAVGRKTRGVKVGPRTESHFQVYLANMWEWVELKWRSGVKGGARGNEKGQSLSTLGQQSSVERERKGKKGWARAS